MLYFIVICLCFFILFHSIIGLIDDIHEDKIKEDLENGSRHNDC